MLKMPKIDQIHLRAVMLCMSKMSKMGKEHTHTCLLITFLIFNRFQSGKSFGKLRLRAFQPYHQILHTLKHVEDVKDRSSTLKGCNAMYVEDVKDVVCSLYATLHTELLILLLMSKVLKMSNTINNLSKAQNTYKHVFAHNFLNI